MICRQLSVIEIHRFTSYFCSRIMPRKGYKISYHMYLSFKNKLCDVEPMIQVEDHDYARILSLNQGTTSEFRK
jgi:hypothetical protein